MDMIELYKVLPNNAKIIVVCDCFKWQYLNDRPLYMGEIYDIPVKLVNKRITFLKPCIINDQQFIFCEVD